MNESISNITANLTNDMDGELFSSDIEYQSMNQSIDTAPVYLFCCALSLASISAFLRAGFVLKFLAMIICITVQGCVLKFSDLYLSYNKEIHDGYVYNVGFLLLF